MNAGDLNTLVGWSEWQGKFGYLDGLYISWFKQM